MDIQALALIALAFALGGLLKGATGAGAPIIAVPLLAVMYDVRLAVALFVIPNIVSNLWQGWAFRHEKFDTYFLWSFALAGAAGAAIGTLALAGLNDEILTQVVAVVVIFYVAFRLSRPSWRLKFQIGRKIALPVGFIAGIMQGATGVSAPVSITFLNAMHLDRSKFIFVISWFFLAMGLIQLPAQFALGVMTSERLLYSSLALIPLLAFMPVGAVIGRKVSQQVFSHIILFLLSLLAVKLIADSVLN